MSCFEENVSVTASMCIPSPGILRSYCSAEDPSSLICSIPNSVRVDLIISGGELILPLTNKNLECTPHVLFLTTAMNSPFMCNSFCYIMSLIFLVLSSISSADLCCNARNWNSSITFMSAPHFDSALIDISFIMSGLSFLSCIAS